MKDRKTNEGIGKTTKITERRRERKNLVEGQEEDEKEVRQINKHITQNGKLGLSKRRRKGENSTINEMNV